MCRLLFYLLPLLLAAVPVGADEAADLRRDYQLLEAELQLARSGKLYIVFDLVEHQVVFKASGATLSRLALCDQRQDGPEPAVKALTLASRETWSPPRREAIIIPENDDKDEPVLPSGDDELDLQALELGDMPDTYSLILNDGTRIDIRSVAPGFVARAWRFGRGFGDSVARGGRAVWQLFGNANAQLKLTLSDNDARQLYWSFAENAPCLIRTHSGHP